MFRAATLTAKIGVRSQPEMERVISALQGKGYAPLLRSMFAHGFSTAGLGKPSEDLIASLFSAESPYLFRRPGAAGVAGDIFLSEQVIFIVEPRGPDVLQASAIAQEQALRQFCGAIVECVRSRLDEGRVRAMDFAWTAPSARRRGYVGERYALTESLFDEDSDREVGQLKFKEPDYHPQDAEAAVLLSDRDVRQFILKLAQLGKMVSKDAASLPATGDPIRGLLSLELLAEEYLLTCRQDQHTICIASSRDRLPQDSNAGLRCSVCGRPLSDENLQIIYTLANRGKKLIDGSLWMCIWMTELLARAGINKDCIRWSGEAGGDEIDMVVENFASRVFLELKDREFGLGDVYPFAFRVARYGGSHGVVVTTEKVSSDARQFFNEEQRRREPAAPIEYLEGRDGIVSGVAGLVNTLVSHQVRRSIRSFWARTGIDVWPIIDGWLRARAG